MFYLKIIITIFVAILLASCSEQKPQEDTVPNNIAAMFQTKYPDAKDVEWKKEEDSWEAEFKLNDKNYEAEFSLEGTWEKTEYDILQSELPAEIKEKLQSEFADYSVLEAEHYEMSNGDKYEIKMQKGGNIQKVEFDTEGNIIKVEGKDQGGTHIDND